MRKQAMLVTAALAAVGIVTACGDDTNNPSGTTIYVANLSDANEVPPSGTGASGVATYTLTGRTITYRVVVSGLSGAAIAAHIHVGAAGVNGPIIVPFNPDAVQTGQLTTGTINLDQPISNGSSTITGDSLLVLFNNGNAYTNVHTQAHSGGEIRGQIAKQ